MKVLLAIDGSACSEVAAREVARRPWPADTQVRIVSVVEPAGPLVAEPYIGAADYFDGIEQISQKQAKDAVTRAAEMVRANDQLQVSTEVLRGSAKGIIVEEAESWGADLIVVGSHGYRTWERMLLGSVSQAVAAHAQCSVEIVRCRKKE
jgi:nucleotide-binding universal stress UspA family protein